MRYTLKQSTRAAKINTGSGAVRKRMPHAYILSSQCPKYSLKVKNKYGLLETFNKEEIRISRSEAMPENPGYLFLL